MARSKKTQVTEVVSTKTQAVNLDELESVFSQITGMRAPSFATITPEQKSFVRSLIPYHIEVSESPAGKLMEFLTSESSVVKVEETPAPVEEPAPFEEPAPVEEQSAVEEHEEVVEDLVEEPSAELTEE